MRIGIDARCLMDGKKTGVEEYTQSLILNLLKNDNHNEYVIFINSYKKIETDFSWIDPYPNVTMRRSSMPNKLMNGFMWALGWPKIDTLIGGVDVLITPNILFFASSKHCKKVLTMHDLSFERFPESFSWKRRLWHFLVNPRRLCQQADRILAVSKSTQADLIGLYKISSEKIKVFMPPLGLERFFEAVPEAAVEDIKKKYNLPDKFILYLGTLEPRKNIVSLIKAFEYFKQNHQDVSREYSLVIAGGKGWLSQEVYQKAAESPVSKDIIFTGFIADEDKPLIYKAAMIFVYPSFFEGFGFPPLEAMASGTPTITSNCSSLPEVVGDGALLIDPYRPYEIVLGILNLLQDRALYLEYVKRGQDRAKEILEKQKKDFSVEIIVGK